MIGLSGSTDASRIDFLKSMFVSYFCRDDKTPFFITRQLIGNIPVLVAKIVIMSKSLKVAS